LKGIGLPAAMCIIVIPFVYIYRKVTEKIQNK
jgi:hypothetical protein